MAGMGVASEKYLRPVIGFREKLRLRQESINSVVCVGLDPLPEKLPRCLRRKLFLSQNWKAIAQWMMDIVDETAPYASMYKPQKAHYEAIKNGDKILRALVAYIHEFYPDIPVFLDCKRGDIGRTQQRYKIAHFELDGVDGMNFSPYMGRSCMEPLFDPAYPGRAIVGLCYTSNPEAREVQDIICADGRQYWEHMAEKICEWAYDVGINENAGLVMAAAYSKGSGEVFSEHLSLCRKIVRDKLWFLILGVGTQEGFVLETILASFVGWGSIAINSSSAIIFASSDDDYAAAAGQSAKKLYNQCREALEQIQDI